MKKKKAKSSLFSIICRIQTGERLCAGKKYGKIRITAGAVILPQSNRTDRTQRRNPQRGNHLRP